MVWGIWGHRGEAVLPGREARAAASLPAGLDPVAATFARVGAVALNAVLAADVHLGEIVAVFGQGVLGLLATRLAQLSGARVVAVDTRAGPPGEGRRSTAPRATVDAARGQASGAELRRLTDGRGADVAIEISGSYPALHEAIRAVAVDGRVVAAGFYQGDGVGLRLGDEFHHNRVQIVSSQIGGVPPGVAGRWNQARLNQHVPPARPRPPGRPGRAGLPRHPGGRGGGGVPHARPPSRRGTPGGVEVLMIKISCQEQLLPGDDVCRTKWEFAARAGYDGDRAARPRRLRVRATGCPSCARPPRDGVPMPSVCVDMLHFIGAFDADLRRDAIAQLNSQLSVIADAGRRRGR